MPEESQEFHIPIAEPMLEQKASLILAQASGLSQQQVKAAMKKGAVWLEAGNNVRRIRRASTKLALDQTLHFYYAPHVLALEPPVPKLVADEHDYSVWMKPTGLLCQGSKWSDHCTINRWIETEQPFEQQPQRNCFIVHRLDKAACGLVLIAHTKQAAQKLAALFENREIEKHYRVIVEGEFPKGVQHIDTPIDGRAASSVVERISYDEKAQRSLLDVDIKTGRKHQIRLHMSQSGFAVVGDRLHGNAQSGEIDLQLQSYSMQFTCPLTEMARFYPCPEPLNLIDTSSNIG